MLFSVIRSLFSGGSVDFMSILMQIVAVLFVIFCILPLHEFAHGWVAYKLGDNTAKYQGRLTFNPIASVDPMGALFLLLFGFGWAKPVPVNPNNFKNPKRGMAITALAGPISNLLASLIGALIYIGVLLATNFGAPTFVWVFFQYYIIINVGLAVFNLLPIPRSMDHGLWVHFSRTRALYSYYRYQNMIMMILMLVLFTGLLDGPIGFLQNICYNGVMWLAELPYQLLGLL
ncbi:site-2 protease family protein [Anaeromassilibacillus sp. SJQ-1]|uniref:site-2 protease family protein n=1 Tax=Anaeromassilibacillus sp. SJQ-1 TaxID=3375419 RepID=UPI0039890EA4